MTFSSLIIWSVHYFEYVRFTGMNFNVLCLKFDICCSRCSNLQILLELSNLMIIFHLIELVCILFKLRIYQFQLEVRFVLSLTWYSSIRLNLNLISSSICAIDNRISPINRHLNVIIVCAQFTVLVSHCSIINFSSSCLIWIMNIEYIHALLAWILY